MLQGLNHITLAVSDLDVAFEFYTKTLGMKPHVKWASGAYLSCGDLWFCLSLDNADPAKDYTHIAFTASPDEMEELRIKLNQTNVTEWKINSSEGDSIYLLDPDGHKLEIHCGDLQSRLTSLKDKPYKGLVWYEGC